MRSHSKCGALGAEGTTRTRRRLIAGAALATAAAVAASLGAPAQAAPSPKGVEARSVHINLVTINDFHGRIEQSGTAGGIARLGSAVDAFRAQNPNTVFAAAGDLIGASTFTSFIQQDVPTIESLNAAGLDVSSVGNHEFDQGYADLTERVMPLADWEYLGANIHHEDTGEVALPEYWLRKYQGVTIGFIGAVTDELPSLVSPAGMEGISVEAPVAAANRVANKLSDGKQNNGEADIVILLVHEGAVTTSIASAVDPNTRFGQIVLNANSNIDAIVSGHTHLPYNHVINGRPVISSGQYGERFSNMEISYDRATKKITKMENTIYTMAAARDSAGNVTAWLYEPDPTIVPIVAAATAVANELGNVQIGVAEGAFRRAQQPGLVNGQPALVENRGGESTLGNFGADVQLWSLNEDDQDRGVQITFMNPGGLRADINADGTTFREAADVQPFANTLVTFDLTGAQIKSVLEEQWQPAGASRPMLKLGVNKALTYTYDPTAPQGSHITEIFLDGAPLDPGATYKVGANSFLASGGDNFFTLAQGTNKADTGKIDLTAMVAYFQAFGSAAPDFAQRAVGVDVVSVAGPATVNLSSLDFSTDTDEKAGTVTVALEDGTVLTTATVDASFPTPSAFDEIGRATVTFPIPAGATADTRFVITTEAGTTTSFTLPL
jgi:5'-nucleotidase